MSGGTELILDLLRTAQELADPKWDVPTEDYRPKSREFSKASEKFHGLLAHLLVRPSFVGSIKGKLKFGWQPAMRAVLGQDSPPSLDDSDIEFGMQIVRLAEYGLIRRVRKCPCGKWIVARLHNQEFCSTGCRQRQFRSSENYRAKRRKYMRDRYHLLKSGKAFARERVRGKRRAR